MELTHLSASELAAGVTAQKFSAVDVIEAHLARIEAVNPSVNAVVAVLPEAARAAAAALDARIAAGEPVGPLAGVPFTVKANIDVAGQATTWGVPALADAVVPLDAPVVERMRAADAIPIGRTNLPDMALRLAKLLASGKATADIVETLGNVAISLVLSVTGGFAIGALIHGFPRLRAAIDPFLASYYALPFFAFYPLFIVLFGLGRGAIVAIGFLFGVVAMIIATLNGFDRIPRVLLRTAAVHHMSPAATALLIKPPSAVPYLFTGIKLAIAYCFIGVIAAEFIMASSGLGYAISYAFNNFDNGTMYALMLFVIVLVTIVNALFYSYERRLLRRWGR